MPLNLSPQASDELTPRISVIGVGGAGGNAVNNMINADLEGVEFLVANTDAQAVNLSKAPHKIQLGTGTTKGLGAGSRPDVGREAAEESIEEVLSLIEGSNMVFITAGMGGGTGTGAAPVIAEAARERGILTVGVVTKPFQFEGARRMRTAEAGIEELQSRVDTLLIIPNQNLFRLADENTTFADAFAMADEVLHAGVRGITDLMIVPGLINLDFADVRSVMSEMGKAMMGTGEASGTDRAVEAAISAISNPLLDETSMKGARGVLINITGGLDMKLFEVDEAANRVRAEVDPDANIIVGSTFNQDLEGTMRVSVVATGIEAEAAAPTTTKSVHSVPGKGSAGPSAPPPKAAPAKPIAVAQQAPAPTPTPTPAPAQAAPAPASPAPRAAVAESATPPRQDGPADHAPADPVGSVHDRIRRMLTEDGAVALRPDQSTGIQRPNPFRETGRGASPIESALGKLRDTFVGRPQPETAEPRRSMARDAFADDSEDDLEIPAFLRRSNGTS